MKRLSRTLFVLVFFISSNQGEVNNNSYKDDIDHLKAEINLLKKEMEQFNQQKKEMEQINQLKKEMEEMRQLVQQHHPDTGKSDLGSIEDDVKQNAEDIIELRMDVIQQDYRINEVNKDVQKLNTSVSKDLETLDSSLQSLVTSLKETLPPIGTVLAWHAGISVEKTIPGGWQRCDGSLIEQGPLAGQNTPDLNGDGRFLRGGADGRSGEFEEDAIQDHIHMDEGHRHSDLGHSHADLGHSHVFDDEDGRGGFDFYFRYNRNNCQWLYEFGTYNCMEKSKETPIGHSSISTDSANIETSTSNLGGIEEGRLADETRVKNMKIVWIMRIF